MANSKTDYITKVITDGVAEMLKPKPVTTDKNAEGTMYALKRVANGYLVSVIPPNGVPGDMFVYGDWDSLVSELRLMMHPSVASEGH